MGIFLHEFVFGNTDI